MAKSFDQVQVVLLASFQDLLDASAPAAKACFTVHFDLSNSNDVQWMRKVFGRLPLNILDKILIYTFEFSFEASENTDRTTLLRKLA